MKRNLNRAFCLLMTVMIALTVCIPAFAVTTSDYNPEHVAKVTHIEGLETCTAVAEIHVQENRLTELDLSGAGNVTQLYCNKNHLTQLDTSSMTAMTVLSCGYNPITALDLAANTALTELYCHDMQLESLDISALTNLQKVWCQNNRIKGHLDLTQDPNLLMVDTSGNRISSVDMYSSWYGETIHADNIGGGYVSITAESVLDNGAWTFPAVCVAEENEYVTFQYWLDNTTGEIVSTDAEFTVERGSVGNYIAVFQPIAEHLVFFMDRDGTMLSRQSVLHSGSAVAPEVPAREYYSFSGWAGGDYTCVTEDMVLVAQYSLNMIIGDVNYNGAVEIADAALALRAVMGLSQLDYEQQLAADLNSDGNVLASDAAGILRLVINK